MRARIKTATAAALLLASAGLAPLRADTAVTTAYLLRGVNPQQDALGGGALTAYGDPAAQWDNPAALGGIPDLGVEFSHEFVPSGGDTEYLAAAAGFGEDHWQHFGIQGFYQGQGDTFRSSNGTIGGAFTNTESLTGLSYCLDFGSLSLGVGAKVVNESLAGQSASPGALADAGFLLRLADDGFLLAGSLRDLGNGPAWTGESFPGAESAELGARESLRIWSVRLFQNLELTDPGSLDNGSSLAASGDLTYGVGVEYTMHTDLPVVLRVGYAADSTDPGPPYGLSAGFGVTVYGFDVSYAFSSLGDLGASNRLGITWKASPKSADDVQDGRFGGGTGDTTN